MEETKEKRALLIQVDFTTGKRAGNINPRDPGLKCYGQSLEKNCCEIRVVEDNRDMRKYENIDGIKILNGVTEINAAIDANIPEQIAVFDMSLMIAHMKEKNISLDTLAGMDIQEITKVAKKHNLAGVKTKKPEKIE